MGHGAHTAWCSTTTAFKSVSVAPDTPIQRCWAHKMRNLINHSKSRDEGTIKRALQRIYQAPTHRKAEAALRAGSRPFCGVLSSNGALHVDIEELLACLKFDDESLVEWRIRLSQCCRCRKTGAAAWAPRTTSSALFVEVRRRTRPMGERIPTLFCDTIFVTSPTLTFALMCEAAPSTLVFMFFVRSLMVATGLVLVSCGGSPQHTAPHMPPPVALERCYVESTEPASFAAWCAAAHVTVVETDGTFDGAAAAALFDTAEATLRARVALEGVPGQFESHPVQLRTSTGIFVGREWAVRRAYGTLSIVQFVIPTQRFNVSRAYECVYSGHDSGPCLSWVQSISEQADLSSLSADLRAARPVAAAGDCASSTYRSAHAGTSDGQLILNCGGVSVYAKDLTHPFSADVATQIHNELNERSLASGLVTAGHDTVVVQSTRGTYEAQRVEFSQSSSTEDSRRARYSVRLVAPAPSGRTRQMTCNAPSSEIAQRCARYLELFVDRESLEEVQASFVAASDPLPPGVFDEETEDEETEGAEAAEPQELTDESAPRGTLDAEVVRSTVRSHIQEVRFCYEQRLAANPNLTGRVVVHFDIRPSGRVGLAEVGSTTLQDPETEACILAAVRSWRFPQPVGGHVGVNYPFVLESE